MKKILLLLLLATFGMQAQTLQNPTFGTVKLKNNVTDNSATKVNVQSTDGTINTISKSDLVNVVEVNDVPSLPITGVAGKIYVVSNVNKIYRWNGTFYQELAGSDISGKEDIANKQNSLVADGSNTKYPTVTAVNTGLGLKENILNDPITGVGSQNNANTYALQDGTVLYHSAKWFVPSGAVSTIGATVTSVGTQFTSAMVGAKLTINGEWRIITAYTNATNVTVASAYSQNYSGVVAGSWGCYSRCSSITSTGHVYYYSYQGMVMFTYIPSDQFNVRFSGFSMIGNEVAIQPGGALLRDSAKIFWSNDATYYGTKDLGLRRNSAGVLEIYDGITPTGLEANRRDLLARNLFGSKVLIGSIVDDNVNQGQYTGTVSSGTTALNNTPPTANNQLTRKDYVDTGLALKANLASPSLTGTPTAPTATAGANTTQVATTAFVTGANAGNVKLTGNQTISGVKSFSANTSYPLNNGVQLNNTSNNSTYGAGALLINNNGAGFGSSILNNSTGFGLGLLNVSTGSGLQMHQSSNGRLINLDNLGAGIGISLNNISTGTGIRVDGSSSGNNFISGQNSTGTGFNYVGQHNGLNTFTVDKLGATTATSFIKSSTPATNILLAGGGDIAQNTAFNKNFGTTAGTVVEGGTLGSNAYSSTAYLPLSGGTLTGILNIDDVNSPLIFFRQNGSLISLITNSFGINSTGSKRDFNTYVYGNNPYGIWTNGTKKVTVGGDGNTTFSGTVTASSYTATSLPVFENNAAASSLAVGQFYRTSIGVLMVKF